MVRTPWIFKQIYPACTWRLPTDEKVIYLTFDDGPTPEVTEWTLNALAQFDAKATFFVLGKNVEKYPDIVSATLASGHRIGNHSFSHPNGWEVETPEYLRNVQEGAEALQKITGEQPDLFRPPYGRMKFSQYKKLKKEYQIVMWHIIGGDFVQDYSPEKVLENLEKYAAPGSVIVLHDSVKCGPKMKYALPKFLENFSKQGYSFESIPSFSGS